MFKPLELFIGLRYFRAKRRNQFVSFIGIISILGIALGVTTLITVMSVMNGFTTEIRERILGMAAHATITEYDRQLNDWPTVLSAAEQNPLVTGAAPFVRGEVMLSHQQRVSGGILRGVDPGFENQVSEVGQNMLVGELSALRAGEYNIILGSELAAILNVGVGDTVTVITPNVTTTIVGMTPRLKRFNVVGLFQIGMQEYDRALAMIHLDDASKLFRMNDRVSGVRLRLEDMFQARTIARDIALTLEDDYWISDWTQENANYFRAVQIERRVMFIILTMILAVAAFNIVSTLIMVVTDKQSDIAILRTLGMTPRSIMIIFIIQGTLIGMFGALLGMFGGVLLSLNIESIVAAIEGFFGFQILSADVYYISDIPSSLDWSDVIVTGIVAFFLSVSATLYPAWRAAKTHPAEALRYE